MKKTPPEFESSLLEREIGEPMRTLWLALCLSLLAPALAGCHGAHRRSGPGVLPPVEGESRSVETAIRGEPPVATEGEVRPPAPSPAHVWVPGGWRAERERSVWVAGHWLAPPGRGSLWVSGHWAEEEGRRIWVGGHWE